MKIAVVGAGGVGGYVAAMLARAGMHPRLVARGANKEAIERNGIIVDIGGETVCARIEKLSCDPAEFAERMDCVLFCTKGYDLDEALSSASSMIGPETLLVPLGNGVANAKRIEARYPENLVANGAIYIVSHLLRPGVVEVKGKGAYIVLGCDSSLPDIVKKAGESLKEAGISTKVSDTITTDVWKKYLLISAMATLTSYYDEPMGAVVQKREDELRTLLREIVEVGKAEGAELGENDIQRVIEQVRKVPYDSPTSMWLDFREKRKNELEELGGYVVELGRKHAVSVPLMQRYYEELKRR